MLISAPRMGVRGKFVLMTAHDKEGIDCAFDIPCYGLSQLNFPEEMCF